MDTAQFQEIVGSFLDSNDHFEKETGDSIHFAPPLTSRVSYGAKLRLVFRSRPMNYRETVMRGTHNDRCQPLLR